MTVSKTLIRLGAILALTLAAVPGRAEEFFVMSSTVASLEEGAMIDGAAALEVPAGGRVTLVAKSGAVVTLEGPHSGPLAAAGGTAATEAGLFDALGELFQGREKQAQAGVYRNIGPLATLEDPWAIDTTRWGRYCVLPGAPVRLWRADTSQAASLKIKHARTGADATVNWGRGDEMTTWPEALAAEDGTTYLVRRQGNAAARRITIHVIPASLAGDAERVVWMARRGCINQARLVLDRIR